MSVPTFKLYDELCAMNPDDDVVMDKKKIIDAIKTTQDPVLHTTLYAIIKHHSNLERGAVESDIPYSGEFKKHNLKFNIDNLPVSLQKIIQNYIHLYLTSLHAQRDCS